MTSVEVKVTKRADDEDRLLADVPVPQDEPLQIEVLNVDVGDTVEKELPDSICPVVGNVPESSHGELVVVVGGSLPVKVKGFVKVKELVLGRIEVLKDSIELSVVFEDHSELEATAMVSVVVEETGPPCCVPESTVPLTTMLLAGDESERGRVLEPEVDEDDKVVLEPEASWLKRVSAEVATESVTDITRVTVSRIVLAAANDDDGDGGADVSGVAVSREVQESTWDDSLDVLRAADESPEKDSEEEGLGVVEIDANSAVCCVEDRECPSVGVVEVST